jgi:hypothetical protein
LYNVKMKFTTHLIMAAGLITGGCSAAGAIEGGFPLCMYGVETKKDLAIVKEAGFNCFQTYTKDPAVLAGLAAEAGRLKLKMLAYPDGVIDSSYSVRAKTWPMLAWYLYDEPDIHGVTPAELDNMDRKTKAWSPGQPTAFVVGQGSAAFNYGTTADALMVDWYPVPHLKLESLGYQVSRTRAAVRTLDKKRPGKPVWAVIQAFDWRLFPQHHERRVGRFPTLAEIRFMTYLALVRGADGLFYFTFSQEGKTLDAWPDRWFILKSITSEINALRPMLEKGKWTGLLKGPDPRLEAWTISRNGKRCAILINTSNSEIHLNAGALKDWRPLFEEKRFLDELLHGQSRIPPYRVLVLEN